MARSTARKNLTLLLGAAALLAAPVLQGTAWAAPIFGQTPRTQFFNGTAFRSFALFESSSGGGKDLEVWRTPFIGSYAFGTDATATLVIPYLNKRFETPTDTFRTDGLGDMELVGKYTFYRKDGPFSRIQAAALGGLKFPSGSNSVGPGIKAAPPLQLGSGSVDGIVGAGAGYTSMRWSFEGFLTYKANSRADDFRFGDVLAYDLYAAYQTYPDWPTPGLSQLTFSLELNGRTKEDNEVDGRDVSGTGGTVLFLAPGVQYIVSGNLLLETGVQARIYEDFGPGQLEPDYNVLFGFRYLF